MNIFNDFGLRQNQQVIIAFDITDMIGMLCPAKIRFTKFMVLNHRPHGSI